MFYPDWNKTGMKSYYEVLVVFIFFYSNLKFAMFVTKSSMFKKLKLSETAIKGIIYQMRYLISEKNASDEMLAWHLKNILSDLGVKVDYIPEPPPWKKKKE